MMKLSLLVCIATYFSVCDCFVKQEPLTREISREENMQICWLKKIELIPGAYEVRDSICGYCHKTFSRNFPDLKADCMDQCFELEAYGECMKWFEGFITMDPSKYYEPKFRRSYDMFSPKFSK